MLMAVGAGVAEAPRVERDESFHGRRSMRPSRSRRMKINPMVSSALVAGLCVALVLSFLSVEAGIMAGGYELARVQDRLKAVRAEHDRLKLMVAELSSLERIEACARTKLGMVDPSEVEYLVVEPVKAGLLADSSHGREQSRANSLISALGARVKDPVLGLMSVFVARWFGDMSTEAL